MESDDEPVRHSSRRVYCVARSQPALISTVERLDWPRAVRFVLWCSLRHGGLCDEHCLSVPFEVRGELSQQRR